MNHTDHTMGSAFTRHSNRRGRAWRLAGVAVAASLLLSGCAMGGLGGFPGQSYPGQSYPGQSSRDQYGSDRYGSGQYGANQVLGSVEGLDPSNRRIVLSTQGSSYGGGSRVDVFYDQRTRLIYQGRQHPVEGLERGDVIRVDAAQSGGRLFARNIEVVRNVRDGQYGGGQYGGDPYGGSYGGNYGGSQGSQYGGDVRGTIGFIDPRARVIEVDSVGGAGGGYGSNNRIRIRYDQRTVVQYQGRAYRPEDLDRGDLVRVQARQMSANDWLAERIVVERSVRR